MAKRRYLVVGPHVVLGKKPGDEFMADLSEEQERTLVKAGHLRPVRKQQKKEEQDNG